MKRPLIDLHFRPTLELLTPTRSFVSELFKSHWMEEDVVYRIVVTLHELLENVMKYSADGVAHLSADLAGADRGMMLSVRVSNECEPERLSHLRGEFETMQKFDDAITYYTALMQKNAMRANVSGLGLARIWAEAGMDIRCEIAGSKATIVAQTQVEPMAAAP
jgi:hypothetical protein